MFDVPLHLLINHFPIALAIMAFFYDGWAVYTKRPELHDLGYSLSLWAGVTSLLSVVTGLQIAGLGQISKGAITGHALFAALASLLLMTTALLRYSARARQEGPDEKYSVLWLVLQAAAAGLIVATLVTGHRLVFGG